jgi:TonB family protein
MWRSLAFGLHLALAHACAAQGTTPPDSVPVVPTIDDTQLGKTPPVEVPATFPGGQEALAAFMVKEVKYPKKARRDGVQGQVVVAFIVDKDGSVTDVQVARGVDPLLDAEAVRAVQAMPKWTPGTMNGRPVKVKYTLPVRFKLQD